MEYKCSQLFSCIMVKHSRDSTIVTSSKVMATALAGPHDNPQVCYQGT